MNEKVKIQWHLNGGVIGPSRPIAENWIGIQYWQNEVRWLVLLIIMVGRYWKLGKISQKALWLLDIILGKSRESYYICSSCEFICEKLFLSREKSCRHCGQYVAEGREFFSGGMSFIARWKFSILRCLHIFCFLK